MKYSPYSISKSGMFLDCQKKFKLKYVDKIKTEFTYNVALYKGSYIHEIIENEYDYDTKFDTNEIFTQEEKDKAKKIVKSFEKSDLGKFYSSIEDGLHEEQFGLKIENGKLVICSYWDKGAWYRGAIDYQFKNGKVANNIDWKSGADKSNLESFGIEQSMMYSIFLFLKYPDITKVVSKFVFVEHCTEKTIKYTRDKFTEYVKHFYKLTKNIEAEEEFKANITPLCDWCDYQRESICTEKTDLVKHTNSTAENISKQNFLDF